MAACPEAWDVSSVFSRLGSGLGSGPEGAWGTGALVAAGVPLLVAAPVAGAAREDRGGGAGRAAEGGGVGAVSAAAARSLLWRLYGSELPPLPSSRLDARLATSSAVDSSPAPPAPDTSEGVPRPGVGASVLHAPHSADLHHSGRRL